MIAHLRRRLPAQLAWMGVALALLLPFSALCAGLSDTTDAESNLTLHGFGTLGLARSSSGQAEFVRDLSQPKGITDQWSGLIDSVLGVQANWRVASQVELVGQVLSRLHYDHSQAPELMWAYAKWEPDPRLSLRGGRIGADFMMLADSRLVGYSYLTVRPSADFFGPLFFSHLDGADASLTLPLGQGLMHGKVFFGATQEQTSGAPGIWDTSGSPVRGFVLDYQTGPWLMRVNAASIRFSRDLKLSPLPENLRLLANNGFPAAQAAADALTTSGTTTSFYALGLVYDQGPLQVQGMVNKIHQETGVFQDSKAAYLLAGYRLGALTPYTGVSRWISSLKPYSTGLPDGPAFAGLNAAFNHLMLASASNQTTYTLGMRWDMQQNWAAKLQWDGIRGQSGSRFPFASTQPGWNGRTDVLSMSLDFVF